MFERCYFVHWTLCVNRAKYLTAFKLPHRLFLHSFTKSLEKVNLVNFYEEAWVVTNIIYIFLKVLKKKEKKKSGNMMIDIHDYFSGFICGRHVGLLVNWYPCIIYNFYIIIIFSYLYRIQCKEWTSGTLDERHSRKSKRGTTTTVSFKKTRAWENI